MAAIRFQKGAARDANDLISKADHAAGVRPLGAAAAQHR
jgi:hypothetical protein